MSPFTLSYILDAQVAISNQETFLRDLKFLNIHKILYNFEEMFLLYYIHNRHMFIATSNNHLYGSVLPNTNPLLK